MSNLNIYHYTPKFNLSKLLKDGVIKRSQGFSEWEKPAVWLSCESFFENSAFFLHKQNNVLVKRKEREVNSLGKARIKINPSEIRTFTFNQFKNISRISTRNFKTIQQFAEECKSDPNMWRTCFSDIEKQKWEKIEIYNEKKLLWEDYQYLNNSLNKPDLFAYLKEIKSLVDYMDSNQKNRLSKQLTKIENKL